MIRHSLAVNMTGASVEEVEKVVRVGEALGGEFQGAKASGIHQFAFDDEDDAKLAQRELSMMTKWDSEIVSVSTR